MIRIPEIELPAIDILATELLATCLLPGVVPGTSLLLYDHVIYHPPLEIILPHAGISKTFPHKMDALETIYHHPCAHETIFHLLVVRNLQHEEETIHQDMKMIILHLDGRAIIPQNAAEITLREAKKLIHGKRLLWITLGRVVPNIPQCAIIDPILQINMVDLQEEMITFMKIQDYNHNLENIMNLDHHIDEKKSSMILIDCRCQHTNDLTDLNPLDQKHLLF